MDNMLIKILRDRRDGEKTDIRLTNGDIITLSDFEMVDESIYDRKDIFIADILAVKYSKSNSYDLNIKIEMELGQIAEIRDTATQRTIWSIEN